MDLPKTLPSLRQEVVIGPFVTPGSTSTSSPAPEDNRTSDVAIPEIKRSNYIKNQRRKLQKRFDREPQRKLRDFKQREIRTANELVIKMLNYRQEVRENHEHSAIEQLEARKDYENCKIGFIHALQTGNTETVRIYAPIMNLNQSDDHGVTPLMLAASTHPENTEVLKILLEHGAQIHAVDDKGMMALDYLEESFGNIFLEELEANDKKRIENSKELLLQAGCKNCDKDLNLYKQAREEWHDWKRSQEFTEPLYRSFQRADGSWHIFQMIRPREVYRWIFNHIHADQQRNPQSNEHVNPKLTFQEVNELLFFCTKNALNLNDGKSLLDTGSDLINQNDRDWTKNALGKAMAFDQTDEHPVKGHPHMVNILLKAGANIEIINDNCHHTPLMHAVMYQQKKILTQLLDAGANRNARNVIGNTALILEATAAATHNRDHETKHEILKILLKDPDTNKELRNFDGDTALFAAFKYYNGKKDPCETIKLLLDYGVDIRAQNQKGNTLLMLAIQKNHIELVKLLLSRDPEILEIPNQQGDTPLTLALRQHNNQPLLRVLLRYGVHVDATDKDGNTALMRTQDINMMKLLLSPPRESRSPAAEIDAQNKWGETALTIAIKWAIKNNDLDHLDVIKFLINSGANIHHTNPFSGRTPLSYTDPDVATMMGGNPDSAVVAQIRQLLVDEMRVQELRNKEKEKGKQAK